MRTLYGLTLIDLLIYMALLAILLGLGSPNIRDTLAHYKSDTAARTVWRTLAKARESAVLSGDTTTFCGIDEHNQCVRNNIRALAVFHDSNDDQQIDNDETLVTRTELKYPGSIRLQASRGKRVTYRHNGRPRQLGGSIILCHNSGKPEYIRRVTFNPSGRHYLARDKNGDGIIAGYDGAAIEC